MLSDDKGGTIEDQNPPRIVAAFEGHRRRTLEETGD